jgi:hypothetical protein
LDLDKIFTQKVDQAHHSVVGKFLDSLALRLGGPEHSAFLNVLCTAGLGTIIIFPLFMVGGIWVSSPPLFFTLALLFVICGSILSFKYGEGRKIMRPLLAAAIILSLPFGLLSLPLLHELTIYKKKNKK